MRIETHPLAVDTYRMEMLLPLPGRQAAALWDTLHENANVVVLRATLGLWTAEIRLRDLFPIFHRILGRVA